MAQPGRAPGLGPGGRRFESDHPDTCSPSRIRQEPNPATRSLACGEGRSLKAPAGAVATASLPRTACSCLRSVSDFSRTPAVLRALPFRRCRSASALAVLLAATCATSATAASPPFRSSVTALPASLRATMTGVSWRPGCPVGLDELRLVRASHWGFDGRLRTGRLIVHRDVASDVASVLRRLLRGAVPDPADGAGRRLRRRVTSARSRPTTRRRSTAARSRARAVGRSTPTAGRSISTRSRTPTSTPTARAPISASRPYLRRTPARPGMAVDGGAVVRAFATVGWSWGGSWTGVKDYQHFSASGR